MTDENPATTEEPQPHTEPAAEDVHGHDHDHEHDHDHQHDEPETPEKEKLHQTVEIRDIGPCKKYVKVSVSRDDIDRLVDEQINELEGDAVVPGFRPGKAPREIVVRKYRKQVNDQVKMSVLMAS